MKSKISKCTYGYNGCCYWYLILLSPRLNHHPYQCDSNPIKASLISNILHRHMQMFIILLHWLHESVVDFILGLNVVWKVPRVCC